jgi:hypothetical protein
MWLAWMAVCVAAACWFGTGTNLNYKLAGTLMLAFGADFLILHGIQEELDSLKREIKRIDLANL